jgi:hypothetical protein
MMKLAEYELTTYFLVSLGKVTKIVPSAAAPINAAGVRRLFSSPNTSPKTFFCTNSRSDPSAARAREAF